MELQELRLYSKVYKDEFEENIITLDLINFEEMIRFREWGQYRPIPNDYLPQYLGFEYIGEQQINEYESHKRYSLHNVIDGTSSFIMSLAYSNYGGEDYWQWLVYVDDEIIHTYKEIAHIHEVQDIFYSITGVILK